MVDVRSLEEMIEDDSSLFLLDEFLPQVIASRRVHCVL